MSATADQPRAHRWWAWPLVLSGTWIPTIVHTWDTGGPLAALRMIAVAVAIYAVALGVGWLVEARLAGRARLWGRIAEVSVVIGVIVFGISLASGGGTLLLAGAFWAFVTGALILLIALRRYVTT